MDNYEFNIFGAETYNFIYDDFCSNYIEFAKFNSESKTTKSVLCMILTGILKMLHPFMPFVTEEIYQMLPIKDAESIMISEYPKYNEEYIFNEDKELIDKVIEYISLFRNKKLENNIGSDFEVVTNIDNELILKMLKLEDKKVETSTLKGSVLVSLGDFELTIYYDNSKQKSEELDNLLKEKETLENSIARRSKLLANENYVAKAPENIVMAERDNLQNEKDKLEIVLKRLEEIK